MPLEIGWRSTTRNHDAIVDSRKAQARKDCPKDQVARALRAQNFQPLVAFKASICLFEGNCLTHLKRPSMLPCEGKKNHSVNSTTLSASSLYDSVLRQRGVLLVKAKHFYAGTRGPVQVVSPCTADWEKMIGDDKI